LVYTKQLDTQISLFKGEGRPDVHYLNQKVWLIIITGKLMRKLMIRFIYVTIEDLSRMLLDSKSDYIDISDSIDMSDIYDNSDPETSIIYSELNSENSKKLVKNDR
jgi:hypothetical protein